MHGRVYPALEESLLELFGEEALPLHVGLGTHRLLIPRCANDDQVARDSAARQQGLHARAAATAAAARSRSCGDALMLRGESFLGAFRPRDALVAFGRALALEERAEAAMAAGELYARAGVQVTAGARCARAYAAGAG